MYYDSMLSTTALYLIVYSCFYSSVIIALLVNPTFCTMGCAGVGISYGGAYQKNLGDYGLQEYQVVGSGGNKLCSGQVFKAEVGTIVEKVTGYDAMMAWINETNNIEVHPEA